MLKKWFARLIVPLLAIVALCPIAVPQAFAAQYYLTVNTDPSGGVGGTTWCEPFGQTWSASGAVEEGSYTMYAYPSSGYQFDGFYDDNTGSYLGSSGTSVYVDHDRYVTARFSPVAPTCNLTVSVGSGSGSVYCDAVGYWGTWMSTTISPSSVNIQASADYGYEFEGWYVNGSYQTDSTNYWLWIDYDTTIEARFYPVPILHTVAYDTNGGGGSNVYMSEMENSTFYLPNPSDIGFSAPAGCVFDYWSIWDGYSYSSGYPGDAAWMGYGDLTIYAIWAPSTPVYHNVNFITYEGSGSMSSLSVAEGDWFQVPDCGFTPVDGRKFKHWSFGTLPGEWIQMTTTDITLEAVWEDATFYLVFIDKNGATGYMEDPWIQEGRIYELPESTYTPPEGKYFAGWYLEGAGVLQPGTTILIDADKTLVAQWEDIYCTVYIMPNGGDGWVPDPSYIYGTVYELPECPFTAPEGKEFKGWDMGQPGDKITLYNSITINALWGDKEEEVAGYTFASGNAGTWTQGSTSGLSFVVKRAKDDSTTFSHFSGGKGKVLIDGKQIAEANYTAASGSLRLALNAAYMQTLSTGPHTIEIVFDDGSAKGSFTVAKGSEAASGSSASPDASGSASSPSADPNASGNASGNSGGQSSGGELPIIPILLGIIALALIAIFILLLLRRRK